MKLLLDTNIFLEVLLRQTNAADAMTLLRNQAQHSLFVSDYALHSIATLLVRRRQPIELENFLRDIVDSGWVDVVAVRPGELASVSRIAIRFGLDFDDAYQYKLAEDLGLALVSFDGDFDRTAAGRKTPRDVLSQSL